MRRETNDTVTSDRPTPADEHSSFNREDRSALAHVAGVVAALLVAVAVLGFIALLYGGWFASR